MDGAGCSVRVDGAGCSVRVDSAGCSARVDGAGCSVRVGGVSSPDSPRKRRERREREEEDHHRLFTCMHKVAAQQLIHIHYNAHFTQSFTIKHHP